jgi:glycosyltransferase involved in cell wall biosynthesis
LVAQLKIAADKVCVVPNGVEHTRFAPHKVGHNFFQRYRLDPELRYVLYVGSENPRKNLPRLLKAFAMLREETPDLRLIKIGSPEYIPQGKSTACNAESERHR